MFGYTFICIGSKFILFLLAVQLLMNMFIIKDQPMIGSDRTSDRADVWQYR